MGRYNALCPHNGLLLGNNKTRGTGHAMSNILLNERIQAQENTHHATCLNAMSRIGETRETRSRSVGARGYGAGVGMGVKGSEISSGGRTTF